MLARYTTRLVLNHEKRQVLVHASCLDFVQHAYDQSSRRYGGFAVRLYDGLVKTESPSVWNARMD